MAEPSKIDTGPPAGGGHAGARSGGAAGSDQSQLQSDGPASGGSRNRERPTTPRARVTTAVHYPARDVLVSEAGVDALKERDASVRRGINTRQYQESVSTHTPAAGTMPPGDGGAVGDGALPGASPATTPVPGPGAASAGSLALSASSGMSRSHNVPAHDGLSGSTQDISWSPVSKISQISKVSHTSLDSQGFTHVDPRQLRSKSVDNTGRDLVSASVVVDRGEALLMQLREMEASDARGTVVATTRDENGKISANDGHLVTGARPVVDDPVGGTVEQECAPSAGPAPVLDPGPVAELKGDTNQPTKHPSAQAILLPQGEILKK